MSRQDMDNCVVSISSFADVKNDCRKCGEIFVDENDQYFFECSICSNEVFKSHLSTWDIMAFGAHIRNHNVNKTKYSKIGQKRISTEDDLFHEGPQWKCFKDGDDCIEDKNAEYPNMRVNEGFKKSPPMGSGEFLLDNKWEDYKMDYKISQAEEKPQVTIGQNDGAMASNDNKIFKIKPDREITPTKEDEDALFIEGTEIKQEEFPIYPPARTYSNIIIISDDEDDVEDAAEDDGADESLWEPPVLSAELMVSQPEFICVCPACKAKFIYVEELQHHLENTHPIPIANLTYPQIFNVKGATSLENQLMLHVLHILKPNHALQRKGVRTPRLFQCTKCGKCTMTVRKMRNHENRIHGAAYNGKQTQCYMCQRWILNKNIFKHLQKHVPMGLNRVPR